MLYFRMFANLKFWCVIVGMPMVAIIPDLLFNYFMRVFKPTPSDKFMNQFGCKESTYKRKFKVSEIDYGNDTSDMLQQQSSRDNTNFTPDLKLNGNDIDNRTHNRNSTQEIKQFKSEDENFGIQTGDKSDFAYKNLAKSPSRGDVDTNLDVLNIQ